VAASLPQKAQDVNAASVWCVSWSVTERYYRQNCRKAANCRY